MISVLTSATVKRHFNVRHSDRSRDIRMMS